MSTEAFDETPWNECATLAEAKACIGLTQLPASSTRDGRTGGLGRARAEAESDGPGDGLDGGLSNSGCEGGSVAAPESAPSVPAPIPGGEAVGGRGLGHRGRLLTSGRVRGRLVLFPHGFLHGERLDPNIVARLLVGRRPFQ